MVFRSTSLPRVLIAQFVFRSSPELDDAELDVHGLGKFVFGCG